MTARVPALSSDERPGSGDGSVVCFLGGTVADGCTAAGFTPMFVNESGSGG